MTGLNKTSKTASFGCISCTAWAWFRIPSVFLICQNLLSVPLMNLLVHPLLAFLSILMCYHFKVTKSRIFEEDWIVNENLIILFCPCMLLYLLRFPLFFLLLLLVFRFLLQSKQASFNFEFLSHTFCQILSTPFQSPLSPTAGLEASHILTGVDVTSMWHGSHQSLPLQVQHWRRMSVRLLQS